MAGADLDHVIRSMGKKQHQALMAEARKRRAKLMALAAKARTGDAKARYRQTARDIMGLASAAARRLLITAENTADSYARAMKKAVEDMKVENGAKQKSAKKPAKSKA